MAEPFLGARALLDIVSPTGVDAGEVLRFSMQDGTSTVQVIQEAAAAIGAVNAALAAEFGALWTFTQEFWTMYRNDTGTRTMTPEEAEFSTPDGVRSNHIGSMLPLKRWIDSVEWSRAYLEEANMQMVRNDLALIAERWRSRVDYDVLTRLFTSTENVIGTTGYDVGLAIGTGTNVNYIPPTWGGYQFTSSHTHYKFANGTPDATNIAAMLNTLSNDVRHHGHSGRLVAFVSDADVSLFTTSMVGFVPLVPFNVSSGSTGYQFTQGEVTGVPGELFGYFNSTRGVIELRYHARIPTGYIAVFKSYGTNNPKNVLAVRTSKRYGFGLRPEPQVDRALMPKLDKLIFLAQHGVGVNDRTAAAVGVIASGAVAYTSPTLS